MLIWKKYISSKKKSNKMVNYIAKVDLILYNINKLKCGTGDNYVRR